MKEPSLKDVIFKISLSEKIVLTVLSVGMIIVSLLNTNIIFKNPLLLGMFLTSCFTFGFQVMNFLVYLYKKNQKNLVE